MKTIGNDSAHPEIFTSFDGGDRPDTYSAGGLTKREYFAAMAMQGLLANSKALMDIDAGVKERKGDMKDVCAITAILALNHSDALIAELNKQKEAE